MRDTNHHFVEPLLEQLRADFSRAPGSYLTWKNFRSHQERLHISTTLGTLQWLKMISVIACKRHLDVGQLNESQMYLYQLRFLLERLSWLGRQDREVVAYTLAHIRRFELAELRHYEAELRDIETEIDWCWLDPAGGSID